MTLIFRKSSKLRNVFTTIFFFLILLDGIGWAEAEEESNKNSFISIATGDVGGVYFSIGTEICREISKARGLHGVRCGVVSTAGSKENFSLLSELRTEFAIVQSDLLADEIRGARDLGKSETVIPIIDLYPEPLHILVGREVDVSSLMDLSEKRINVNSFGSGSQALADRLFDFIGLSNKDYNRIQISSDDQHLAFCNDEIDVAIWVAGVPNASARLAQANCHARLIGLSDTLISEFLASYPSLFSLEIPNATYSGMTSPIATIGPRAVLVASANVKHETIEIVSEAFLLNFNSLASKRPILKNASVLDR